VFRAIIWLSLGDSGNIKFRITIEFRKMTKATVCCRIQSIRNRIQLKKANPSRAQTKLSEKTGKTRNVCNFQREHIQSNL